MQAQDLGKATAVSALDCVHIHTENQEIVFFNKIIS